MTCLRLVHVARNSTKSEAGEVFELVVGLQDFTHLADGFNILIAFVKRVKGRGIFDLAVGRCEVNGD